MVGHRFPSPDSLRSFPRIIASVVIAAALFAVLPQAWSATPVFTVANNTFPSTEVGKSVTQNVTLTLNTAVPITKIAIAANFTEYELGTITGCTVDPSGNTVVAANSVCTIPVTFKPAVPGTASAPPPISRSAPLLVTDVEGGSPNGYSFALSGSATGAVFAFAPGFITSVVGNPSFAGGFGTPGCTNQTDARGDGCPATDASIYPSSMAVDPAGIIYIADFAEKVIHRVDAVTQIISVFAGKYGVQGPSGSGGLATSATFFGPLNVTVDQAGNVFLYDITSGIWKIDAATGIATDIGGYGGYTPEQAIAQGKTLAQTTFPELGTILADSSGNLYVSTYQTGSVYKINLATGLLTAIVGNDTIANPAKGVPGVAASAQLGELTALALDSKGNLYIGDIGNAVVYRVDTAGNISAYAGTQATSAQFNSSCTADTGNWGTATSALVFLPASLAFDAADNLYIGEPGSQGGLSCPIRRVDATTGIIHNVAGDTTQTYNYLSGVGASETYLSPNLVSVDGAGNIYVGEQNIEPGISKISPSESALIFPRQSQFVTSTQLVTASNLGIADNLTLSNYPFVIAPVPSTATPSPFSNAPLSGNDPEDCSSGTLAPGGVCGILVAYYPTSNVVSTATDTVEDNSLGVAGTTNVINISGNAYNGATATLSPDPITFTSQPVGTPTAATAVQFGIFLNPLLTIESVAITGPNASSFSLSAAATSPCTVGGTIPNGGGDCNLGVVFDPATGGPISATLTITWQAGGVTYSLSAPLSGTGAQATPPATPVIYPASNTYNAPVAVAITDTDASATIDYSTDGTTPSLAYTAPFTVSQTATVMTFATEGPGNNSSTINSTYTIQPYLSFNPAAVGEASASAQTLTALFSFAGSTTPTAALHYGLDYSTGSVACTSPTTGIETCSVPVTFIPTLPGPRKDALILSSGGSTIATVYLGGTGNAPLALIQPGVVTNPVSSFPDYVYNSTVDENGTVYFLTGSAGTVYSLTKSGTPTALPITGLGNPTEIAVDGAGILYVAPNSGSEAYLITFDPQTGTQGTISMVPPAPFQQCNTGYGPYYDFVGVAVDDLGNIYGLEGSCQEVIELQANGTITVTALNPNVGQIGTIAVDASANGNPPNIFASGNNKIDEITYQGQSAINTTGATNIAVDAAATIYATRYSADGYQVAELASSDYSIPQAGLDGGTNGEIVDPLGLGLDSDGTLYLGNYQDLDKVDRTQGAIAFGGQQTGVASSAQNISIYNGGNQPLTVSNIVLSGASSGFAMSAASTNSCINGNNFATVAVGALCQISVIMTPPHAGNFTGSITFTTNSDNHSGSSAVVALSGYVNGIYITVSPDPVAFGNQVTGTTSAVMTATVTNNGFLYSAGVNGPSEVQADNAFTPTLGACADASLAVGQSCKLSVTFAPSLQQPYNDTITFSAFSSGGGPDITTTFGVTGTGIAPALTPQAITFTQPTSPITWSSSLTVALVATGGASGNPVVFTIDGTSTGTGSISGSTLSITTPGTFVIDANQAGNASYSAAPQVQRSLVVNKAPQTINFTAPTSPLIYTTGLTIPLVATGGASGNAVVFTIDASSTATGSISGSTLTVTSTGKLVINANQTGNTDYLAATQVQQTVTVNAPSPQTITFAQPATPISYAPSLTVTLVASGGASGNPVVFTIDGASTGTGSISGSTLSITTPGTFVIDANQAGNSSYSAAPQVQRSLVVNKASQTINFTAPTSPVIYTSGLTISLTATGGSSGNAVVFAIDSSSTATGSISGSTLTVTSTGKLVINANQAGNTDYLAATQVQQTVQVNSPSAQAISFAQPTSPITWSSSLTVGLVATGGASGNPVVFTIDGASAGTGSISGSTLSITTPGTFVIDANQTGNASYSAAPQVQRTLVVNQAPQSINFTQPTSPVTYTSGLTISLTATGGASGKPIVFTLDASSTASASISGSTVTVTSAGNVVINANQAGNPDYSAAPQVQRTVLVNPPPADFTISAAPRSQTVSSGSTATYNVTLTGTNNFDTNIALTVSGYSPGSTVQFSPPQVDPVEGPVTSTLTVHTPAGLFAQSTPSTHLWPMATPALALLLLLPFRRWRNAFRGKLLLLVVALASLATAAALTGCGGGFALPQTSQSYTLTITGTGGSDNHSTTVQLTVQ